MPACTPRVAMKRFSFCVDRMCADEHCQCFFSPLSLGWCAFLRLHSTWWCHFCGCWYVHPLVGGWRFPPSFPFWVVVISLLVLLGDVVFPLYTHHPSPTHPPTHRHTPLSPSPLPLPSSPPPSPPLPPGVILRPRLLRFGGGASPFSPCGWWCFSPPVLGRWCVPSMYIYKDSSTHNFSGCCGGLDIIVPN